MPTRRETATLARARDVEQQRLRRELGKDVRLEMHGADTELDKLIVEARGELDELPRGRFFPNDQLAELVTDVLPSLEERIPVDVRSERLPATSRSETPRVLIEVSRQGDALSVLPKLVERAGRSAKGSITAFYSVLVEADDPDIRQAIVRMYRRFHELIQGLLDTNREGKEEPSGLPADATAWALIGLATVSNIIRELELLRPRQREDMFVATAKYLVNEDAP